jgi:ATP-dependent exoDNAse (exonuclease V) beta subunit
MIKMSDCTYFKDLEHEPDDQQRNVCRSLDNTVVAAGAGSGKTQVLATRFAWLVISENIKASEILTLTFTKKAVAEMYERIYQTLNLFANDYSSNITEEQRNRAKEALSQFNEVHIQTLDSYCGLIVRQAAVRYGIRPDYVTGASSNFINDSALRFALKHRENDAIKYYCDAGDIENFAKNILANTIYNYTSIADKDTFFTDFIPKQKLIISEAWNNNTKEFIEQFNEYEQNVDLFQKDTELMTEYSNFEFILNMKDSDIDGKNDSFISLFNSNLKLLKKIYSLIKSASAKKGFSDDKKELLALLDSLFLISEYISSYSYYEKLMILLNNFLTKINREKKIRGELSFSDVSNLALKILIENKDIRQQEKKSYSKIMIDEFQDNNMDNRNLLYLISEKDEIQTDGIPSVNEINPKKLFFVGDEKQSIYKFRGADVSTFMKLKKEFGKANFKEMFINYRSSNELITAFNLFFSSDSEKNKQQYQGLFINDDENADIDYEAKYLTKAIGKEGFQCDYVLKRDDVPIHIKLFNKQKEEKVENVADKLLPAIEQQCFYIAKTIRDIYDLDQTGTVKYADFAILDKSRTNRSLLIKWLKLFNIPFTLDQQNDLFGDGIVNDFFSFLRLCVYPSDIHAFCAFLCSPLVGLSENGMETVLSILQNKNSDEEFILNPFNSNDDDAIKNELTKINENEYVKYKKGADFYNKEKTETLCRPITQTLTKLWYEKGYFYETLIDKNLNLLSEQYDYLFELARVNDEQNKNIVFFIDELEKQKESSFSSTDSEINIKDIFYPLEKEDAIQVMTIHKSKGLQFNHVFLLGCMGLTAKSETKYASVYYNKDSGCSLSGENVSKSYFSEMNKEDYNNKEVAEMRRVIYVGMTRAINDVYIVGTPLPQTPKNLRLIEDIIEQHYVQVSNETKIHVKTDDGTHSVSEEKIDLNETLGKTYFIDGKPFDLQLNKLINRKEADSCIGNQNKLKSDNQKNQTVNRISEIYQNDDNVKIPDDITLSIDYKKSPSSIVFDGKVEEEKQVILEDVDNNVLEDEKFSSLDFGTLIHKMLENYSNNISNDNIINDYMFKNLSDSEKKEIIDDANKLCNSFINSKYSTLFKNAKANKKLAESEYKFRMKDNEYLVTGSIDLLFENEDNSITIIDYKTNKSINSSAYYLQQAYYRKAVADIFRNGDISNVKTILFYLRFSKDIDVSDFTKKLETK